MLTASSVYPQHVHPRPDNPNVIDGSVHPEQIPDIVAYRLYFVALSEMPNPSDEVRQRQFAHLESLQLATVDRDLILNVLENFKVNYVDLIAKYNNTAEAANKAGTQPDILTFRRQRDDLVQATHERLKSLLPAVSLARLEAHIQNEKKHMTVGIGEVTQ